MTWFEWLVLAGGLALGYTLVSLLMGEQATRKARAAAMKAEPAARAAPHAATSSSDGPAHAPPGGTPATREAPAAEGPPTPPNR